MDAPTPLIEILAQYAGVFISFIAAINDIIARLRIGPIGLLTLAQFESASACAEAYAQSYIDDPHLSVDQVAAIYLYTMDTEFFKKFNELLRTGNYEELSAFAKYIMLMNRAILKCPKPTAENNPVYRGLDFCVDYLKGDVIQWFQYSSTSNAIEVIEQFLASIGQGILLTSGHRMQGTLFTITIQPENNYCRDISKYSAIKGEGEILFVIGACFEVTGVLNPVHGLKLVQLLARDLDLEINTLALIEAPSAVSSAMSSEVSSAMSSEEPVDFLTRSMVEPIKRYLIRPAQWTCACSYVNSGTASVCELCGSKNPQYNSCISKEFSFQSPFDHNGVLYFIGTNGGTIHYKNPHDLNYVVASKSSNGVFNTNPGSLVGRISKENTTDNIPNSWMGVDLGAHRFLVVNHFSLRYGWEHCSGIFHFPQNFEFQGSNCGTVWETIERYPSICFNPDGENYSCAHSPVTTTVGFRYFRILQYGLNQGGSNILALSGLELYGNLTEQKK